MEVSFGLVDSSCFVAMHKTNYTGQIHDVKGFGRFFYCTAPKMARRRF
jgi:hypothetical protein